MILSLNSKLAAIPLLAVTGLSFQDTQVRRFFPRQFHIISHEKIVKQNIGCYKE